MEITIGLTNKRAHSCRFVSANIITQMVPNKSHLLAGCGCCYLVRKATIQMLSGQVIKTPFSSIRISRELFFPRSEPGAVFCCSAPQQFNECLPNTHSAQRIKNNIIVHSMLRRNQTVALSSASVLIHA